MLTLAQSADALLRGQPKDVVENVFKMIHAIRRNINLNIVLFFWNNH